MTVRSPRRQLRRAVAALDDAYGRPALSPRYPPVDELVFTVLSQNTADVNTERTFAALKARFPDWSAARDASAEEIEETIALGGLAHTKAPRIKRILAAISAPGGAPDLGVLGEMTDAEAQDYLVRLPGVGPKTAACVLMFSFNMPIFPVDTHIHRIAIRLGLVPPESSAADVQRILTPMIAPRDRYAMHILLIAHGRKTCRAQSPKCEWCGLIDLCPYGRRVASSR